MASGGINPVSEAKRVLLWTNSDPSTLGATTISISMSDYDSIEIECTEVGTPPTRTFFTKSLIGTNSTPVQVHMTSVFLNNDLSGVNSIGIMTRGADVYSGGIVFSSGYMIYDGTLYKDWDNRAVPYRVWGIKY